MSKTIGIIVHGASGKICTTQHLGHSLLPIIAEGGLPSRRGKIMPRLLLVGRSKDKMERLSNKLGVENWTTDLDAALADPAYEIFFDAAASGQRPDVLRKAIAAGKHIYTEKPVAPSVTEGTEILQLIEERKLKHGCVEDKLSLPGLEKMAYLVKTGYFGRVLNFKLEFGWWVFDGKLSPGQRPSWNYRSALGGGLTLDMYPHWRYIIEGLLGPIASTSSSRRTSIPERIDEGGNLFSVDVDDTAIDLLEMESGAIGTICSSWATRVRRDDLLTLQVDGTAGSAVSTLHRCYVQSEVQTPKYVGFDANKDVGANYLANWAEVPTLRSHKNPYRVGWEGFLRHVVNDEPFSSGFDAGIRDIQFAEACNTSARERRWVDMKEIA